MRELCKRGLQAISLIVGGMKRTTWIKKEGGKGQTEILVRAAKNKGKASFRKKKRGTRGGGK